jgi:conjugal transfer/type IV secretion protein DotA/TraY
MSSLLGFVLPSANDKSVFILNQIMGHITAMIDPSAAPESGAGSATVFSNMMMNFNHVLLGAGTILFAIMVFVGTMNTSNEGTLFGRQWNAMWTPLRLIFGLIFVVPLQSGFCIGQKIILYAILIGISMGTHVWDAVVQQVFDDPAPPPIPSFMYNMVQQRVALEFVTDASLKIYACAQGNCKSDQSLSNTIVNTSPMLVHTAPVGGKQIPGDRYASTAMVGALQQQGEGICDNLFIGLNTVCQAAVGNAIQSGQGNYTYTDPVTQSKVLIGIGSGNSNSTPNAFNSSGSLNVYFSSGSESPGDGIGVSSQQYGLGGTNGGHPKLNNTSSPGVSDMDADGQISIEKSLIKYNLNTKAITNSPQGKKIATGIVEPYVIDGKSCDPNKDDMCNFQTYTDNYMNQLKAQLPNQLAPKQTEGQHQNLVCTAFDSQGNCTAWKYNLTHYWLPSQIGGAPNANNQINLLNSWWIAGESYIILDDQLSRALKMLYQDIQKDMGQMGDGAGSENSVQSAYLIKNQISIWELGPHASTSDYGYPATCMPIYLPNSSSNPFEFINNAGTATFPQGPFLPQAMNLADPKYKFLNSSAGNFQNAITYQGNPALYTVSPTPGNSADNQNWPFASCLGDEARGSQVLTYQYWLVDSGIINPGTYPNPDNLDKGGPFTWSDLIEKFNPHAPNAICTNQACGPTYGLLQKLPPEYQFPVGIMLSQLYTSYSKHRSEHPVSGGSTYFDDAAPYMENMLTVLDDNKILSNQTVQLPVKSSLDRIFEGLLGSQGGTFSDDSQGVTVSANSVLQELYNLGSDPKTNGVVSKQFSLIQQAQTVGMSMIMVALNSITTVYNHFANKLTSFNQYLENVGIGVTATAAALGALGFVPFIGSAATGAAQLTVSITQLIVQLKTIAVMTAVGMSLAWLPIAAFVLISIFTTGIQFALLIPLMPYILFWAGQIAWLLGAIEGVVAAPIIMLGLATPGGHDFMGHTVPAVKMLLGVVFRPVLMVIGMVTGILLTYVVIHFSAQGFHTVLNLLLNNFSNADQSAMGVLMLIATLTYGTLMVMAFTKCFSPIYQIPEKVMQWVGGQADRAGQEELQQVSGAVQQSSQKAGESGQSGVSSGIEAQKQQTQQTQGAWSSGMQGIQQGVSGLTSGLKQDAANFQGKQDSSTGGMSGGDAAEAALV